VFVVSADSTLETQYTQLSSATYFGLFDRHLAGIAMTCIGNNTGVEASPSHPISVLLSMHVIATSA
jgi:hypothetical protein